MKSNYKYIKFIQFRDLLLWDVKRQTESNIIFKVITDKLGKYIIEQSSKYEISTKGEKYKILGVNNVEGIFDAYEEYGDKINQKYKKMEIGWLAYNPYRINVGSIGIKRKEHKNDYISPAYVVFSCNEKVNPEFIYLLFRTQKYNEIIRQYTTGSVRQNLTFSNLSNMPLPLFDDFEIQTKLVYNYSKLIQKSEECSKKSDELEKEIERYLLDELGIEFKENNLGKGLQFIQYQELYIWGVDRLQKQNNKILFSKKYINKKLNSVVYVNPKTNINNLSIDQDMSFIPMECISDVYGEVKEKKIGKKESSKGYTKFQNRDLIWARITPCMQNGKSAIVDDLLNGFGYGSTEYHVIRTNGNDVSIDYIYHLLRMDIILKDAQNYFTGSAGQQRVPKTYLENLQIPIPPLEKQNEIVEHISLLKEKIKTLREEAEKKKVLALTQFENEIFV